MAGYWIVRGTAIRGSRYVLRERGLFANIGRSSCAGSTGFELAISGSMLVGWLYQLVS